MKQKEYQTTNKDTLSEYKKQYRKANKDTILIKLVRKQDACVVKTIPNLIRHDTNNRLVISVVLLLNYFLYSFFFPHEYFQS